MSWIITTIKIISFLFPFLKELFIGKDNRSSRGDRLKGKEPNFFIKKAIIVLGCASVAANFYLMTQAYNLGRENLELKRQAKEATPKPLQYPEKDTALTNPHVHAVVIDEDDRYGKNKNRDKKGPFVPPALPPDKQNYLRELEEINNIN